MPFGGGTQVDEATIFLTTTQGVESVVFKIGVKNATEIKIFTSPTVFLQVVQENGITETFANVPILTVKFPKQKK